MSETTREFHLGAVLSITHDRLMAPNGMDDVYAIINWMTGDNISTIGLLAAHEPCKAALFAQHPQLHQINDSDVTRENWRGWLDGMVRVFGERLPVTPLGSWEKRTVVDDILDVNRMNPSAGVIVLEDSDAV
jgi:hypothetical protein